MGISRSSCLFVGPVLPWRLKDSMFAKEDRLGLFTCLLMIELLTLFSLRKVLNQGKNAEMEDVEMWFLYLFFP